MRTIKTYVGEVGRTVYPVDFGLGYLDRSHVYVYAGDTPTEQLQYTWPNANQIELVTPFTTGAEFKIRRITPRHSLFNDYENGAVLEEQNLDDSFKQTLMVLEEWEDGSYPDGLKMLGDIDMQGNRILNLAKPLLPHEPLRLQDVNIDVSLIVPDSEFALIRSTITPTPLNGKMWFNKETGLSVGDDGVWKPVGGTAEPQTGGGIVYASVLPEVIKEGTTYFDADRLEHVYSYNDGDSLQYLAIPLMSGGSVSGGSGGSSGGETTFTTADVNNLTLVASTSTPAAHKVKALVMGTGIKAVTTGSNITLNVDLTDTAGVGTGLVFTTDGTVGAKKQIKKLKAGTGVTLSSTDDTVTINASGAGGGGGGGIEYADVLPIEKTAGTTYFDHDKAEFITTYDDGTSIQYLAYPMMGGGAAPSGGGGIGTDLKIEQLGISVDGVTTFTLSGESTYGFKRLQAGDSATVRVTSGVNNIKIDALDVIAPTVAGVSLVGVKTVTTQPIKRLVAGTNVTLNETANTVTINASGAGGGGEPLGDTLTRLNSLVAENNNVPVFTAAGVTQFPTQASTRAMMGNPTVGNTIPMFTGASTATVVSLTPFMVSLIEQTGIPTALAHLGISSGSNTNGSWLRVATNGSGGVQICWHTIVVTGAATAHGGGFISNNASWTYPQAFGEVPAVSANVSDGIAAMVINGAAGHSTSAASFRQVSFIASADAAIKVIAIGLY